MSNCLVAGGNLDMLITVQGDVAVKTVHVAINSCVIVVHILVHQSEIKINGRDVWMVVTTDHLQYLERFVHILESLREVLASMVVETKVRVTICNSWRVISMELLLDNKTLRLKLDSLKVISELVLDVGHLRDAGGNISVDGTSDLEEHVYGLTVKVKGSLVLLLVVS